MTPQKQSKVFNVNTVHSDEGKQLMDGTVKPADVGPQLEGLSDFFLKLL